MEILCDSQRSGRPKSTRENDVESVKQMLSEDRRRTVQEISDSVNLKKDRWASDIERKSKFIKS